MIDPIKLTKITEKLVCKGLKRKYYRFRPASFYGGIATADCVGCNLRCIFCWAYNIVNKPERIGHFYSPEIVVEKLTNILEKKGYSQIRISGNEPTLCKEHLLKVLRLTQDYSFILETNGILIGYDKNYAKQLSTFPNLHVRVSLKGTTPEEFSKLTGAKPEAFEFQIKALERLVEAEVSCHAALIELAREDLKGLKKRLRQIKPALENLEIEPLILYPGIRERLKNANLL